jgi:hypothetical protein
MPKPADLKSLSPVSHCYFWNPKKDEKKVGQNTPARTDTI